MKFRVPFLIAMCTMLFGAAAYAENSILMRQVPGSALPGLVQAFDAALVTGLLPNNQTHIEFRIANTVQLRPLTDLGIADGDVLHSIDDYGVRTEAMARKLIGEKRAGEDLKLMLSRGGSTFAVIAEIVPSPAVAPALKTNATPGIMVLDGDALEREFEQADPLLLLAAAEPEIVRDANGNVAGVRSQRFSEIPLSKRLGLQSGDTIVAVNGMRIDSEQAIFVIVERLSGETEFAAQIVRDGKPITLRYRVQ